MGLRALAVPALAGLLLAASAGGLQAWSRDNLFDSICMNGTLEEMTTALAAGADVNALGALEMSPLAAATMDRKGLAAAKVELLLSAGADPSLTGFWGDSALHLAAGNGDLVVMRILLEAGADVSTRSHNGHTALHQAAGGGHLAAAEMLLLAGAEVNAETTDGDTPLTWCCFRMPPRPTETRESIVRLLISYGATVNADTVPLNLLAVMIDADARSSTLKMLLKAGCRVDDANTHGTTTLMTAAERASGSRGVAFLLENGADITRRDHSGLTALDYARRNKTPAAEEIISLLEKAEKQADFVFRRI